MIPPDIKSLFIRSLCRGEYNLLFGSGISTSSKNAKSEKIMSAEQLREKLCALKGVKGNTTLQRVSSLLSQDERETLITNHFSGCEPESGLLTLNNYLWRRLFTFNIDDILEKIFEPSAGGKQAIFPVNYNEPFEPTPDKTELLCIHLHGWVGKPNQDYVFSHSDYARIMREPNPWMAMLGQILATEPFIIAGTSLNEVDLEFYLSQRSKTTPRKSSGPSILIEPYPDAATENDCLRHGFVLVKATLVEFLEWLRREMPNPPSLYELIIPGDYNPFSDQVNSKMLLSFYSDFKRSQYSEMKTRRFATPFLYGREPTDEDLDANLDIKRSDNDKIIDRVEEMFLHIRDDRFEKVLVVTDEAGTGKSSMLARVSRDLTASGKLVFKCIALSRIDVKIAIACLSRLESPAIIFVDNLADHAEQIAEIVLSPETLGKVLFVGFERHYRLALIELLFSNLCWYDLRLARFSAKESREQIEMYREFGLIGNAEAMKNPAGFVKKIENDCVAIAACKILNDFKPVQRIAQSLWDVTGDDQRFIYLCASLVAYCYSDGVRYGILQSVCGSSRSVSELLDENVPLALTENVDNSEFIMPLNLIYSDIILSISAKSDKRLLLSVFTSLVLGLSPYVNRSAYRRRTPEARLAGRLLDSDKVVRHFLGDDAPKLYESCSKEWAWNSRFWEQRALVTLEQDLETALQYARHAVAIEKHPFTLTTLAKVLFRKMSRNADEGVDQYFREGFDCLSSAISIEGARSRITIHPFAVLLSGLIEFARLGGLLSSDLRIDVIELIDSAEYHFGGDPMIRDLLNIVDQRFSF
jgi:hypothetical protein